MISAAACAETTSTPRAVATTASIPSPPTSSSSPVPLPAITPTVTTVLTDTEVLVLQEAIRATQCSAIPNPGHVSVEGSTYRFDCMVAAGHNVEVRIQRFLSQAEAQIAFDSVRQGKPIQEFHGYPAYEWQYDERPDDSMLPMRHRSHGWQADRWLIVVKAFDDTHFAIAPAPLAVSEAVYQAARAYSLFPAE